MNDAVIELVAVGFFEISVLVLPFIIIFVIIRYFIVERH